MTRLRRVSCSAPGLTRRRRGKGFTYVDAAGRPVTDAATLERIEALVHPAGLGGRLDLLGRDGHIQATGVDAKGRRQYRYHDAWRLQRDLAKHDRILDFAARLPAARERHARATCRAPTADPRARAGLRRAPHRPRASSASAASSTPRRTSRTAWRRCARSTCASPATASSSSTTSARAASSGTSRSPSPRCVGRRPRAQAAARRRADELLAYQRGGRLGRRQERRHQRLPARRAPAATTPRRTSAPGRPPCSPPSAWPCRRTPRAPTARKRAVTRVVKEVAGAAGQHPRRLPGLLHRPADHRPLRRRHHHRRRPREPRRGRVLRLARLPGGHRGAPCCALLREPGGRQRLRRLTARRPALLRRRADSGCRYRDVTWTDAPVPEGSRRAARRCRRSRVGRWRPGAPRRRPQARAGAGDAGTPTRPASPRRARRAAAATGVVVAVLDSWVDARAPRLRGPRARPAPTASAAPAAPDPRRATTATTAPTWPAPSRRRRTASRRGRTVLPVRVLSYDAAADGLRRPARTTSPPASAGPSPNGARVVNLSLGPDEAPLLGRRAPRSRAPSPRPRGPASLVVFSAGNTGLAGGPALRRRRARRRRDRARRALASYSQPGDLAAPGGDPATPRRAAAAPTASPSLFPGNGYSVAAGTSMAAPHVAGVAALLLGQDAARSREQVLERLREHRARRGRGSSTPRAALGVRARARRAARPTPSPQPVAARAGRDAQRPERLAARAPRRRAGADRSRRRRGAARRCRCRRRAAGRAWHPPPRRRRRRRSLPRRRRPRAPSSRPPPRARPAAARPIALAAGLLVAAGACDRRRRAPELTPAAQPIVRRAPSSSRSACARTAGSARSVPGSYDSCQSRSSRPGRRRPDDAHAARGVQPAVRRPADAAVTRVRTTSGRSPSSASASRDRCGRRPAARASRAR